MISMCGMNVQQTATQRRFFSRIFTGCFILLCFLAMQPNMNRNVYAGEIKPGDKVTIITPGIEARLCPLPACGPDQHITRIPEGTVLKVESIEDFAIGTFKVKWFEVVYEENRGWISIYDTNKSRK